MVSSAIQLGFFGSFRDYLDTKRLEQVESVMDGLEQEYRVHGQITGKTMSAIFHHQGVVDHLFYRFVDPEDRLIFDSTRHYNMMPGMMGRQRMEMPSLDTLESELYQVVIDGKDIGTLIVYYPLEYVNIDSQFLEQFNKYIIVAAVSMILISIVVSLLISKKLTIGLRQVSSATRELQNHNLDVRVPEVKQVEEIQQLSTAFNELAESLGKQERLRKQFTNDLAHELRTPLATLRSQIEAFLDGVWEPTPDRLKQGHAELMRLVRLVDDLEKLLAAENPQIQLNITELRAKEVLKSLRTTFQPLFTEKDITFTVEETLSSDRFVADRDRFIQIMMNLLNNALKYTNEGGAVIVNCSKDQQYINFRVEDNGEGISADDLPHIFERFYRGEKSRNRKTGGVGIGLSIAKSLVDAHNGEITIESEKNKGTKVVVKLPIEREN